MNKPAPMVLENQHYVMCPSGEHGAFQAEAVYAVSPEAAVAQVRNLYDNASDFGAPKVNFDLNEIRLATGEELPWNHSEDAAFIVTRGESTNVSFHSEEETRKTYDFLYQGKPYDVRPATVGEKEQSIRENQLGADIRAEEEFDYGFNVLYHQMREEGTL